MSSRTPHDLSTLSVAETLPIDAPPPGSRVSRHVTTLLVTEGVVYLVLEEDEQVLTPGDVATIPAGTAHRFFNAGDEDAHVAITYERVRGAVSSPGVAVGDCV